MRRHSWMVLACVGVAACGAPAVASDADAGHDGATTPLVDMGVRPIDGGATTDAAVSGAGDVTGSVGGTSFDTVASSYVIGAPDDPATTVVYVFSSPVACSELATPGWDRRISNATSVLEMKLFGLDPATFTVVTTPTPAPGEAAINYTLSSTAGTPVETGSRSGTVTLSTIAPMGPATGAFNLGFVGTDHLMGHFNATFCPGAHEP